MNVIFLRKENVAEAVECALDRSILERVLDFLERFFFLKIAEFFFGTRSIPFYSINIFHWVVIEILQSILNVRIQSYIFS